MAKLDVVSDNGIDPDWLKMKDKLDPDTRWIETEAPVSLREWA